MCEGLYRLCCSLSVEEGHSKLPQDLCRYVYNETAILTDCHVSSLALNMCQSVTRAMIRDIQLNIT